MTGMDLHQVPPRVKRKEYPVWFIQEVVAHLVWMYYIRDPDPCAVHQEGDGHYLDIGSPLV